MEDYLRYLCYIVYLYGAFIIGCGICGAIGFQYMSWQHMKRNIYGGIAMKILSIPYSIIVGGWLGITLGFYSPILLLIYIIDRKSPILSAICNTWWI
jgi:hypothetical protein